MMRLRWISPKPVESFVPKIRRKAAEHTLEIAQAVWLGAVNRTPVATGELRASWNLSQGGPDFSFVGHGVSSGQLPPPSMPGLEVQALSSSKFFVTNGKPYAGHVEFGSSTIMPHLMLTRAIQAVDL